MSPKARELSHDSARGISQTCVIHHHHQNCHHLQLSAKLSSPSIIIKIVIIFNCHHCYQHQQLLSSSPILDNCDYFLRGQFSHISQNSATIVCLYALFGCLGSPFLAARAALYLHMSLSNSRFIIQSDRRDNACASGQITSNFLTQASRRLYEIRQPPTSLCTTSNFLI